MPKGKKKSGGKRNTPYTQFVKKKNEISKQRTDIMLSLQKKCFLLALNEEFHFGKKRLERLLEVLGYQLGDFLDDCGDNKDTVDYAYHKVNEKVKAILGRIDV